MGGLGSMADYVQLRVVQRLRGFLRERWGSDIIFADDQGWVTSYSPGERFWTANPVCKILTQNKTGLRHCSRDCRSAAGQVREAVANGAAPEPVRIPCHAGFERLFVPVVDNGEFLGFLKVGSIRTRPFDADELVQLQERAVAVGEDPREIVEAAGRIKISTPEGLQYVKSMLQILVEEIVSFRQELENHTEEIGRLRDALGDRYQFKQLIGKSAPMLDLYELLGKVSQTDAPVLIEGENGTGKELVAKAVHFNSPRKRDAFVVQNCAAFNDNLLESELFGHVRGAFTGATSPKKGLFEVADGGTFFLDEIGEMSPALQAKLLRVLQDGEFTPVGGTRAQRVNVRVIAATNQDLSEMVERGDFREDLYYRVNVFQLRLPPLRERADDIPLLVEHFLVRHAEQKGGEPVQLSAEALERCMSYPWPGNVRELQNELERMVVLASGRRMLGAELLSPRINGAAHAQLDRSELADVARSVARSSRDYATGRDAWAERFDRVYFVDLLRRHKGNIARAAREAGVHRMAIYRFLKKFGLDAKELGGGE